MELKEQLRREVDGWRFLNANLGAWLMQEFVIKKGKEYPGRALPRPYRKMPPKQCFSNAGELARRRPDLRYCEGFATSPYVPMAFHHAWLLDIKQEVIDPTVLTPADYQYVGVSYSWEEYRAAMANRRLPSLFLDDLDRVNVRFLLKECPELAELIKPIDPTLIARLQRDD